MTTRADMPLRTVIEQIVSPEPITRDDFIDDLRDARAELNRAAGEQAVRAPTRPRRALAE
jgi:hypothetical protein